MLVLNNTPFVHACGYLQYLNNALPGAITIWDNVSCKVYHANSVTQDLYGRMCCIHHKFLKLNDSKSIIDKYN